MKFIYNGYITPSQTFLNYQTRPISGVKQIAVSNGTNLLR